MRYVLAACIMLALPACQGMPNMAAVTAATTATLSIAQRDLQNAIDLYGIAKGIGMVASLVNPAVGALVAGITAATDPMVAKAQMALNDATTDANAIAGLALLITRQANSMTTAAAPSIVVVPNPSAGKPTAR